MSIQFYKKTSNDKVRCTLCQHYCNISLNKTGICGVNKNTGAKIECLVYGYPAVINVDPVEKKPLYHFLPNTKTLSIGTVGCNFKCSFCQNHGISQEQKVNKDKYYSPLDIVKLALNNSCDSISYTYNEPTIYYPYIRDIAKLAKANGLKNVFVSNGFESFEVLKDMAGLIDAANIDLKGFNKEYYKKNLGGNLEKLKENLILFKKYNIWIEVTTLIIPNLNDSKEELQNIASFIYNHLGLRTPWHLSAFHPDYKMLDKERTSVSSLQMAYDIGIKAGLKYVYMGNAGLKNESRCFKCNELFLQRITYKTTYKKDKFGLFCSSCNEKLDGIYHSIRKTSVAGSFYSKNCDEVKKQFSHFNSLLVKANYKHQLSFKPKAIIAPHAGFIYSGFTSNVAYSYIRDIKAKRVLVIGPSHKHSFKNASIAMFDKYQTPCGDINIDLSYATYLKNKFNFLSFNSNVHNEHSTETQAPFIKEYFKYSKIVEIVYGDISYKNLSLIIEDAILSKDTFVVISTDLSHFYNLNDANKLDNICLEAIKKLDINIWSKGCEACGRVGVKALIDTSNKLKLKNKILDYRTSYDITQDKNSVVGYLSAIFGI